MSVRKYTCDKKETLDYINGYPAFKDESYGIIQSQFYRAWGREFLEQPSFKLIEYGVEDFPENVISYTLDRTGLTKDDLFNIVMPAAYKIFGYAPDNKKLTKKEAEYVIRYIEPAWCEFKHIDETGFIKKDPLLKAAELLADDEFDDI